MIGIRRDFMAGDLRPSSLRSILAAALFAASTLAECSTASTVSETNLKSVETRQASGSFEIKLVPQGQPDVSQGNTLGRMSIDKIYQGDLAATGLGEMLSVRTSTKGSAGYVAIERVTGTLDGLRGGFVLQHAAVMSRGTPRLTLEIIPDSGVGELEGISGTMTINIVDGQHYYELVYAFQKSD